MERARDGMTIAEIGAWLREAAKDYRASATEQEKAGQDGMAKSGHALAEAADMTARRFEMEAETVARLAREAADAAPAIVRDALREAVAELIHAVDEWQIAHETGNEDLVHEKGLRVCQKRSAARAALAQPASSPPLHWSAMSIKGARVTLDFDTPVAAGQWFAAQRFPDAPAPPAGEPS